MVSAQETRPIGQITHIEPLEHTKDTLERWVTWMNDPEIRQWMFRDLPTSREEINEWLYQATHDPRRHYFSIIQNGENVGFISLRQDHEPSDTGEIGIVIGPNFLRGKGLGKHALDSVLDYAKATLQLTSVRAMIKPSNERSIRLFTGRGFTEKNRVTISGDDMIRFDKQLNEPSKEVTAAQSYFQEIGLETPETDVLVHAAEQFARELESGGQSKDPSSSLLMIDTQLMPPNPEYLKSRSGKEVLVIEYGGSNVRIAVGKIDEQGQPGFASFAKDGSKKIEGRLSKSAFSSPDDLYTEIFRLIDATEGVILPETCPESIGIIWSFPGYAARTEYGVDVTSPNELTKGISVQGMDQVMVGSSLVSALRERYYPDTDIHPKIAVLNDTPAVLFSYVPENKGENQIGVVDGTGFNIALMANSTTYNLEAGSFSGIPLPPYADALETRYDNAGKDLAEKQCSGKYVGDQFDALTQSLIDKAMISGVKSAKLDGRDMDQLLIGNKTFIEQKLGHTLTRDEHMILTDLATRLRNRAAVVVGLLVGMSIRTFSDGFGDSVTVPVEGAFFIKTPGLSEIAAVIASSVAGKPVEFAQGENLGIKGAVAAAATL